MSKKNGKRKEILMEEKILIGRKGKKESSFLGPWQLNDLMINGKWIVSFGKIYDYDIAVEWSRKTGTILREKGNFEL